MQEFVVDLAGVRDADDMHDALAARLPLPAYYGRNLDALYDVLTEFGGDWRIVFRNAGPVADGLRDVCRDAMEETEGLEVIFDDENGKEEAMDNEVLKALRERRSVRAYRPEQIKDEELKAVLDAGTYAPTGMGWQDPWIVAVQDPETVAQLVRMNAKAMGTTSNPYYGAPTIVLVFASPTEKVSFSICDGSLVLGNMMIAAHSIGLGSCWINREREMFETDEGKALMKKFGLPDGLIGIGSIALGYAAVPPSQAKPRKPDYYRIVK